MNNLILEYYPEPAFYSYIYIRTLFEEGKGIILNNVPQDHLDALEVSGMIKIEDGSIILKDGDRWLCDPPEAKKRVKKEPYVDKRVEILADIVGYPTDWHKRNKYESLFRSLNKDYEWSIIKEVGEFWKDNKDDLDLRLNYFLTKSVFKGIKYLMENPESPKEAPYEPRGEINNLEYGDQCPF